MAPSNFGQAGWRRDHVKYALSGEERNSAVMGNPNQARASNAPVKGPTFKNGNNNSHNHNNSNNTSSGSSYNNKNGHPNIFTGIAELFAGLGNRNGDRAKHQAAQDESARCVRFESTPTTTPLTTAYSSSGEDAAGEDAALENRWNGIYAAARSPRQIGRSKPRDIKRSPQEGGGPKHEDRSVITDRAGGAARGGWQRGVYTKRRSFTEEKFVPCYATFTPQMSSECLQEMKYKAPETRVPSAVAPPSSVARPNYHDALRRVAVVVYQHIKTCEWRREAAEEGERAKMAEAESRSPAKLQRWRRSAPSLAALREDETSLGGMGGGNDLRRSNGCGAIDPSSDFNARQAELFHEKRFVSPQLRYKFVQAPMMALPGAVFTLKEVRAAPKPPTVDEIYEFIKTLFNKACLSSECSLVCLIYVERLMETAHVPLLASTWKPILLCGLLLASKVWQDLSSWNVEFSTVYPEYSLKSINRLELLFLGAIRWDMSISSSLYAKYYFALRSLAEKKDFRRRYNQVMKVDAPRASRVQERADAVKRDVMSAQPLSMLSKSL